MNNNQERSAASKADCKVELLFQNKELGITTVTVQSDTFGSTFDVNMLVLIKPHLDAIAEALDSSFLSARVVTTMESEIDMSNDSYRAAKLTSDLINGAVEMPSKQVCSA